MVFVGRVIWAVGEVKFDIYVFGNLYATVLSWRWPLLHYGFSSSDFPSEETCSDDLDNRPEFHATIRWMLRTKLGNK